MGVLKDTHCLELLNDPLLYFLFEWVAYRLADMVDNWLRESPISLLRVPSIFELGSLAQFLLHEVARKHWPGYCNRNR